MMGSNQLQREATDWLILLTSGEATRTNLLALQSWCRQSPSHAEAFASASRLWRALGPALDAASRSEERMARHALPRTESRPIGRRAALGGLLAAGGAGLYVLANPPLGLWPSLSDLAADYHTGIGEQRQISLRDGVSVELNTASSLNLAESGGVERMELISGEAAVAVGANALGPLVIAAAGGESSARMANFNLRHYGSTVCVSCLSGQVEVAYRGRTLTLAERQQATYGEGELTPAQPVDPAAVTAWRERVLIFRNERLDRVIAEVNRYRRGRIILVNPALAERQVTARFKLDRLDDVVTQVRDVFGAQARQLPGNTIVLS
ncbi:FecR family protein [Magnetospirillum fulvum]|nr:FecR domain-containing protein [Magnetospirillum fulvum]